MKLYSMQAGAAPIRRLSKIKWIALFCFSLIFFEAGFRTPVDLSFNLCQSLLLLPICVFFFLYVLVSLAKHRSFSSYEYLVFFLLPLPLWGAICAHRTFGQPLIYGILAARDFFSIVAAWLIYYLLRKRKITLRHLRSSIVGSAWFCLLIFYLVTFLVDAKKYSETSFVSYSSIKGGYLFHFNIILIAFGFVYYSVAFFKQRKKLYLVYAAFFFSYIIIRESRIIQLSTVIAVGLYYANNVSRQRKIIHLLIIVFLFAPVLGIILSSNTTAYGRYKQMYINAFDTVIGEHTEEAGTNVRLAEFASAERYMAQNILFGSGQLSYQWNRGYTSIYKHFYPSDIGVFGVVFIYGILGAILVYSQYLFAWLQFRRLNYVSGDTFIAVCKYVLLQNAIQALTDGVDVFMSGFSMTLIAILFYVAKHYSAQQSRGKLNSERSGSLQKRSLDVQDR